MEEAIQSVLQQSHDHTELIVVDDGSTDGSKETISKTLANLPIEFISIKDSIGNCRAFNMGLRSSSGAYIIDLAADDVLLPDRITEGLATVSAKDIGVEFCNVMNVDENGKELKSHFESGVDVPEGDLYKDLIEKYLISPPGMMIKREVLDALNGYDESLSYEDFDFWIRSSRSYLYGYSNKILVKKRLLPNSHSKHQFRFRTPQQKRTLQVCEKLRFLNESEAENTALRKRCNYEVKQCIRQGNLELIPKFLSLKRGL